MILVILYLHYYHVFINLALFLIITVFINKRFDTSNEVTNKFKIRKRDYLVAPLLIVSYIFITYGWFDYILFSIPTGICFESAMEYFNSLPIVILLIETCVIAPIFEEHYIEEYY